MTRTIPTMAMTMKTKCATHHNSLQLCAEIVPPLVCSADREMEAAVAVVEVLLNIGNSQMVKISQKKSTHWKCVNASFLHGALQLSTAFLAAVAPLPAVSYWQKLFSQCLKPKRALEVHKAVGYYEYKAKLLMFSDNFWPTCLGHNVHFVSFCLETAMVFLLHSAAQPVLGITKMCQIRHQWRWDFFCTRFCSTFPFSLRQKSNVMLSSSLFNKLTAKGITLSFQAVWSRGLRYRSHGFLANDPWKTWFQDIASSPNSVKTSNHLQTSHLTVRILMLEILADFTKLRRFCEVCLPSEVKLPLHQIFVHLGERIRWRQLRAEKVAFNFHHEISWFSGKRKRMKGKKK